jgi:hypothetical protein
MSASPRARTFACTCGSYFSRAMVSALDQHREHLKGEGGVCVCVCVCVCARARVVTINAQTAPSPPMRRRAPRLLKGLTRRHRNRTGRARTAAPLDERGSGRGLMRTARAWSLTTATTPSQVPESNGQEHASPPPPCVVNVGGSSATAGLAI